MNALTIGILGGMGPRATIAFEQRLMTEFSGSDQSLPRIISVNNSQIPDRSSFIQRQGSDPLNELIASAQILQSAKVDIVCMPCNTAHNPKIMARLMASVPLPIIDMPAACMLLAEANQYKKLLILGTAGTAASQIFDQRSNSVTCIYPSRSEQRHVSAMIQSIKQGIPINSQAIKPLTTVIKNNPADAVVLACTELSLLPKAMFTTPTIDSLDVLVKQCVNISNSVNKQRMFT